MTKPFLKTCFISPTNRTINREVCYVHGPKPTLSKHTLRTHCCVLTDESQPLRSVAKIVKSKAETCIKKLHVADCINFLLVSIISY